MTASTLVSLRAAARQRSYTKTQFIILITLVVFVIDFAFRLVDAPRIEIFEHIICNAYYKSDLTVLISNRSEWTKFGSSCVVDAVQSELAILTQFKDTLDMLPSLVLAVPYGILAETFGRKPIMLMSMIGIAAEMLTDVLICWFPHAFRLRIVWITPLLQVLGGGISVTNSMLYTMLADYLEPADRAKAFYLISASSLLGEVTGNTLAATLMRISSWLPIMFGVGIISLSPLLILLLPETMEVKPCCVDTSTTATQPAKKSTRRLRLGPRDLWTRLNISKGVVFKSTNVVLLISAFFLSGIVGQSSTLQLQYVRKSFSWSYSRGALIVSSLPSILDVILFLILLPLLDKILLERMHVLPSAKDLIMVRASATILAFGSLLFALSSEAVLIASISVLTLGDGIEVALRSLLTSLIPPLHVSTIYTTIAVVSGAGGIIAGPILAMTFKAGIRAGGRWLALPFYVVAALCFLILMVVCRIQLRKTDEYEDGTTRDGCLEDDEESSV
ncbi:MFS general substrate transporter [Lojkania enalia]|uniref:MFS general substrate transporter n=1 Tax=Lojkania enalia TaxID=147567 RepID=A0A9P4K243_9PLEO|nr:MFS general substrate transporter [Didymosphaeria enalia]